MDRAQLIQAAAAAADAYGRGVELPTEHASLAGRRFELRLPFGCTGPLSAAGDATGWRYDAKQQTLRVVAAPQDWTEAPWLREAVGEGAFERAEGFPIERPWLLSGGCPKNPDATESPPSAQPTDAALHSRVPVPVRATAGTVSEPPLLAVVQLFSADAPRSVARRDRRYSAVVKRSPEEVSEDLSFAFVLRGRIASFPNGRPITCWGDAREARPRCLIAINLEKAWMVDSAGEQLAEWNR
jgi:hypothetical protein